MRPTRKLETSCRHCHFQHTWGIDEEALADLGKVPQRVGRDDCHEKRVVARV